MSRRDGNGGYQSWSWLDFGAVLGPNGFPVENVAQAAAKGLTLRLTCRVCGTRYINIKGALERDMLGAQWLRSDVYQNFRCTPDDDVCPISKAVFVNYIKDAEFTPKG